MRDRFRLSVLNGTLALAALLLGGCGTNGDVSPDAADSSAASRGATGEPSPQTLVASPNAAASSPPKTPPGAGGSSAAPAQLGAAEGAADSPGVNSQAAHGEVNVASKPSAATRPGGTAAGLDGSSQLWALFVHNEGGKHSGKCGRLKVTVSHHGAKAFRVGFFESEVGGSGADWRGAGWMAAMVAAQIQAFDPATTQISFDVAGMIDGPSAGALMTVGVLATLRGDQVRQDAAMTGTINPDGAIGAVGGIAHKLAGAAEAGKKLVLIPAGVRRQLDQNQGELVDLIERGAELGLEVRPVVDVFEAYELMTGSPLPRPEDTGHPRLADAAYDVIRPKVDGWLVRAGMLAEQYGNLPEDQRYEYPDGRIEEAKELATRANRLLIEGRVAGAARSALDASVAAVMGYEVAQVNATANLRSLDEAKKQAQTASGAWEKLELLLEEIQGITPSTVAEAGWLVDAYSSLVEGYAFAALADRHLNAPAEDEALARENILTAAGYYQLVLLDIQLSQDSIELGRSHGGAPLPADAPIQVAADFFQHAADANLNVFNASIIEAIAQSAGMRTEAVKAGLAEKDETYALVRAITENVTPVLVNKLGDKPAAQYVRLAAAMYCYSQAAALVAKYGSLDAKLEDFEVVSVPREKTLQNMLDTAEEQARRAIQRLVDRDIDPSSVVMAYDLARLERDRDVTAQLSALGGYWNVYVQAQMMARLAGAK